MEWKCAHCNTLLDEKYGKPQIKRINGAVHRFCPGKYSPEAPDCLTLFLRRLREQRVEIFWYDDVSHVS
jgi:hypothetical protein